MPSTKQEYTFSTVVSDSTNADEFIIEFYPENATEGSPFKITKNFDELIEFFNELEN